MGIGDYTLFNSTKINRALCLVPESNWDIIETPLLLLLDKKSKKEFFVILTSLVPLPKEAANPITVDN